MSELDILKAFPRAAWPHGLRSPAADQVLWRYMAYWKFEDLVTTGTLYIPSATRLCDQDPFEGVYPARFEEWLSMDEQRIAAQGGGRPEGLQYRLEKTCGDVRINRRQTFVSCWHSNESESEAQWKLYGDSIAITTTPSRLKGLLPSGTFVFHVNYIDYVSDGFPVPGSLYPYFHKQLAWQHENEVRAVVDYQSFQEEIQEQIRQPPYHDARVPVAVNDLVVSVLLSPRLDRDVESVRSLCEAHGLMCPVRRSRLADPPPFMNLC